LPTDLRNQLQTSLGAAYTLEHELGGGGMSRTYVAQEAALNRRVVVKVLSPDLAAGVSVERFKREIQLAAALQHPHIVPVLSAGDTQGLPFYTMPFVDGESLRARLARGPLGITEAISILKDVARALAFAHHHGIVHRDIKPDNVLLSGGSATVADFGIAKAISAARTNPSAATITQLGTALGTPAYMAPEQAAGDPSTDHRADLYAFGVLGYELLAGRPPFHGLPPQRLLAAHMGEKPRPVSELRADTPVALAELVMQCLEKEADRRPQSAADVARFLDTVTSGNAQSAAPAVLLGGAGMLRRALLLYAAAFVAVAVVARAAIVGIGLPDWVFPGALIVMGLGLPVILFTAYVQRATHRALIATPSLTPGGTPVAPSTLATMALKASPHVSWRRTALGGVYAVGAFIVLIGGWMLLRALGIGPAASLMAAGKLGERDRVILTDFKGPATDSLLGPTVTEAFRTDLAQSANLSVLAASAVRDALRRMQRPTDVRVDYTLAREIATREGIKAVIDGDIVTLGGSYVLSARLVSANSGDDLASFRETATEARDIIPAISRLSKALRSKVGESLRSVQKARSLDKVTTPSLQALQKYVTGSRLLEVEGDWEKGSVLLREAIALDTGFAMAYRKLAVEMNNRFFPRDQVMAGIQKAFDHQDRLTDTERYLTVAAYYRFGPKPDRAKIISAYESLLDIDSVNVTALNNLAIEYRYNREFAKAEGLAKRATGLQQASVFYNNLVWSQIAQNKTAEANESMRLAEQNLPRNPSLPFTRVTLLTVRGRFDSASTVMDSLRRARPNDLTTQNSAQFVLGTISLLRGRLGEGLRWLRQSNELSLQLGNRNAPLHSVLDSALVDAWYRGDARRALEVIERAVRLHPLDSLPPSERPFERLVQLYSLAGRPDLAKPMVDAFDRRRAAVAALTDARARHTMLGQIALAERRYDDAVRELRAADEGNCTVCALPELARTYDLSGNADSALAIYARYVESPSDPQQRLVAVDQMQLAGAHNRLGELYDAKGDREKAKSHYAQFIELWKDADPELQPLVRKARERLATLERSKG
jgi:tetratricopeptide (TPR) repeat protein/tRNA A-37 threonylcarbamoyl transferase component Bud32